MQRRPSVTLASVFRLALATALVSSSVVLVGGTTVWHLEGDRPGTTFRSLGDGIWWALTTMTTVGYGDNTPEDFIGRLVAAAVMLTSIGLITVITAIITSTFVGAATKRRESDTEQTGTETLARLEAALEALDDRLDRMESRLHVHSPPDDEE